MTDPPPAGFYRASDGRDYPVPPGYFLASDGQLYPVPPSPAAAPAPAAAAVAPVWTPATVCMLSGAAATAIGSFLPWASVGILDVDGTDGDGVLTLILAGVITVFAFAGLRNRRVGFVIAALVASVLAALIAIVDIADVSSIAEDVAFGFEVEVGGGLVLTLVGACVALVGAILALARRRLG